MNIAFVRPRCLGIILRILRRPEMMQSPASQMPIWRYRLSFLKTSLFRATSMAFLPRPIAIRFPPSDYALLADESVLLR